MQLTDLTLQDAAAGIRSREISPVDLTHALLLRIENLEPKINAFITLTAESALESARQAEAEIQGGLYRGPLHGVPLALKDLYDTKGVRTSAGSKFFAERVPEEDAWAVKRLKDAGVVSLGKLNMHEIALGVTNINPHYGASHNPWNLAHITGGSSGGSAAALAAGFCLGSLGSDTGGSIRIPASLCGIVGLKPTYGRVSLRGVVPLSWNLDHVGSMAKRVADAALLLNAIAGYDPQDPYSVEAQVVDFLEGIEDGVRGWRIGLAVDEFFAQADPEVLDAVQAAAGVFADLGADVIEVSLPEARDAAKANGLMVTADAAAFHRGRLQDRPEVFGADVRERLENGAANTSSDYILARRTQTIMRRRYETFFEEIDVLLTPATPIAAPIIETTGAVAEAHRLTRFTAPFNLTGLPALALPCGFNQHGLPLGLQLVARPWGEKNLLRAAWAYEQATPWHLRKPELV